MTEFREIIHRSPEYEQVVALRESVLLEPFGIELSEEEWRAESEFQHFGLFDHGRLVAGCFVSPIDDHTGKLRQMAVVRDRQRTGLGQELLARVERKLQEHDLDRIVMDARKPVVGFYDQAGYRITSDEFELVGIPHHRMEKTLGSESEPSVIVLLGAPNEPDGTLSAIARQRCDRALVEHRRNPDWPILPTGGFGEHFNRAPEPHGYYTTRYLVEHGVDPAVILPVAASCHTLDDAEKARPILESTGLLSLILVTSDFHAERARRIFASALPDWRLRLACALSDLPAEDLQRLRAHESAARQRLP